LNNYNAQIILGNLKVKILKIFLIAFLTILISVHWVYGYSSHNTSIRRVVNKTVAEVNEAVTVTVLFKNLENDDLRGFFYVEQIPEGMSVNTNHLKIDGVDVSNYIVEIGGVGELYNGYYPIRWVLEEPVGFEQENPIGPNSILEIVYTLAAESSGEFAVGQYNWVGNYPNAEVGQRAAFGYSDQTDEVIISSLPPGSGAVQAIVYEDAEDGSLSGWDIYDDSGNGAEILNVFDAERNSNVIELKGSDTLDGFRLTTDTGEKWNNSEQFVLEWSLNYTEYFIVYVDLDTTAGHRYLYCSPVDYDGLGTDEYVCLGLGSYMRDRQWYTVVRDLQADLHLAQPDADILEVNGFLIRGSGRLDDIMLHSAQDADGDGLTVDQERDLYGTDPNVADSDGDGLTDGEEVEYWGAKWNDDPDNDGLLNILDPDSNGDGFLDGENVTAETHVPPTIYEDAEDGAIAGWDIYSDLSGFAGIINTYDAERDSRVIELTGTTTIDGFRLMAQSGESWNNTEQFVLEWNLKYTDYFIVYVDVETTAGRRYLYYSPVDYDDLGSGEYVRFGLGSYLQDGQWHTVVRDLQVDLNKAQRGVNILAVNGFLTRGSGMLDNIMLHTALDGDEDGLPVHLERDVYGTDPDIADTDGDGMTDGEEVAFWGAAWNDDPDNDGLVNILDPDADDDGILDGEDTDLGTGPDDPMICEDAEDGTTNGWDIYDTSGGSGEVVNVFDADRDSLVIELIGSDTLDGFRLQDDSGEPWNNTKQFVLKWEIKCTNYFIIYLDVETTAGHKYLYYSPVDYNGLGNGEYLSFGLGSHLRDGQWHTVERDLQADLTMAQPGENILEVNAFLIRGSVRLDDIELSSAR